MHPRILAIQRIKFGELHGRRCTNETPWDEKQQGEEDERRRRLRAAGTREGKWSIKWGARQYERREGADSARSRTHRRCLDRPCDHHHEHGGRSLGGCHDVDLGPRAVSSVPRFCVVADDGNPHPARMTGSGPEGRDRDVQHCESAEMRAPKSGFGGLQKCYDGCRPGLIYIGSCPRNACAGDGGNGRQADSTRSRLYCRVRSCCHDSFIYCTISNYVRCTGSTSQMSEMSSC